MCDRVEKMMGQVRDLDRNNTELQRAVRFTEKDLEQCEISKAGRKPGAALQDMLKRWQAEPVDTPAELEAYTQGLWLTREQFEKQLWEEAHGCELELARAKV